MARTWLRLFAGATLSLTVAGHALADEGKITVFAAASLTNAMQDIAVEYKKEKNVDVVSSFASSSTLARQIEAGAPADLFISADQKWMDYAVDKKAIDTATRETLLGNSLVVVAPKASEQKDITYRIKRCNSYIKIQQIRIITVYYIKCTIIEISAIFLCW